MMSTTIEIFGIRARIEDWVWTSVKGDLEQMLNTLLKPEGPSGADPAPDFHEAERIVKLFDGKIIKYDLIESEEGLVY